MSEIARLVLPALRWDRAHGFAYLDGLVEDALELGVGGFLVEGGARAEVADLIARLHTAARHPLLIAIPSERGAGETIAGLTELPPLGAIASVAVVAEEGTGTPCLDAEPVRRVARLTARELRSIGANWALAPVCNPDSAGDRPRVGSRAVSDDPAVVGAVVAEWIDACQAEAVVACAQRFSGTDLTPFAAAIDAGVASVMVDAPAAFMPRARGRAAAPASVSDLLRAQLGFEGIAATTPLGRDDAVDPARELELAVAAVAAGCDVVLAPANLSGACDALGRAASTGTFPRSRVHDAIARVDRWAAWARPSVSAEPPVADILWTRQLADRAVRYARGARPRVGGSIEVVAVQPTVRGGPRIGGLLSPAAGAQAADLTPFLDVLRAVHISVTESPQPTPGERAPLAIVFVPADQDTGAFHADEADAVHAAARAGVAARRDVVVVVCGDPRGAAAIAGRLAPEAAILCAWRASRPMLEAAARALVTVR